MISTDDIKAIEECLNSPRFLDVPLGSTLSQYLLVALKGRRGGLSWSQFVIAGARRLKYRWLGSRRASVRPSRSTTDRGGGGKACIVLTLLSRESRFTGLVLPLLDALQPEEFLVLTPGSLPVGTLPADTKTLEWEAVAPRLALKSWARNYFEVRPYWARKIMVLFRDRQLPRSLLYDLENVLILQSQLVMVFREWLGAMEPAALITEYDRNAFSAPLVLAAKSMGMPTFSMIHGFTEPPDGYFPVLADKLFCWGEEHRVQFERLGVSPDRLVVTGCPRFRDPEDVDSAFSCAAGRKTHERTRTNVLLATNPIGRPENIQFARYFLEGITQCPGLRPVLRLHPSETVSDYSELISDYPDLVFRSAAEQSIEEALGEADAVVVHNTTFGLEALLAGKGVIVLDVLNRPLGAAQGIVERAGCPRARSSEELANVLRSWFADPDWAGKTRMTRTAQEYLKRICSAYGAEAASLMKNAVLSEVCASGARRGSASGGLEVS